MRCDLALARILPVLAAGLASCGTAPQAPDPDAQFRTMMTTSFRGEGIAGLDRLVQDPAQQACSQEGRLPDAERRRLMAAALATIPPPPEGRYLGDWREGEKLAQSGRGMTWTDPSAEPRDNGGNCYNCHQIDPAEIAHGTIGPSLAHYAREHGVTDPTAAAAAPLLRYTWGKLNNAWAYSACSSMPRFGHRGLLNPRQIQHLMALLLDPRSPVNAP